MPEKEYWRLIEEDLGDEIDEVDVMAIDSEILKQVPVYASKFVKKMQPSIEGFVSRSSLEKRADCKAYIKAKAADEIKGYVLEIGGTDAQVAAAVKEMDEFIDSLQ